MTTPAPPPQQPGQPPPQPQADGLDDAALAVAVAAILAGGTALAVGAGTAVSAAAAVAVLKARFALSSAAWSALGTVLGEVMSHPPAVTGVIGAASAQTSRVNAARRAQYVIAAAKRVLGAAREARAKGEPVGAAVQAQLARERKFYEQHQAAMWNRARAAGQTDIEAAVHGDLLGWNAILSGNVSAECRAADGKNYYASAMPDIGFPGGVHPNCKCFPSAPHPGGKLLPSRSARFARAA